MDTTTVQSATGTALILNVDDAEASRYARSRVLTQAGYRVIEAANGEEALLIAATLGPQLIVLDVHLPGIDGLEVCRRLKADPHTARIMVLQVSSTRTTKMDAAAGLEGGADGYLIEPVEPFELVAAVRALLRLADRREENLRLIRRVSQSERQLIDATEAADCGLWDWEIATGRLQWFGAHERLAGMQPGSFSGKIDVFTQILHPDDRARVWGALQRTMDRQEQQYADEYRFVHPDGSVHWMAASGRFFYDDSGAAVRMTGVVRDITARKQAEDRLAQYRAIFAASTDGIAMIDRDGRYCEQNEAHRLLLGYSDDDLRGRTPALHAGEETFAEIARELNETGRCRRDIRSRRKDGTWVDIALSAFAIYDEEGEVRCYVGIKRDITERVRQEAALKESEARFRMLADHMSQLAWMADASGRHFWYNRRWFEYTGTTFDEMQGWGWQKVHHPDHLARVLETWHRACERGDAWEETFPLRGRDARYRWFLSRAMPIRDDEGRIVRWFGTHTDITELREAEEMQARLAAIVNSSDDAIVSKDLEGMVTSWNPGAERLFGYRADEMIGRPITLIIPPERRHEEPMILDRLRRGEPIEQYETVRVKKDGTRFDVSLSISPLKDSRGRVIGASKIARDITERKRQMEELRRLKDELELRVQERTRQLTASQERLRTLGSQLAVAEQRERQKLARDLHDYLAQMLSVGRMKMGLAKKQPELSPASVAVLQDIDAVFQQALTYTRTMIAELSPPSFRDYGLLAALKWLAERMEKDGLWVQVQTTCAQVPLSEEQAVLVFQCVRELLFNVLKHAGVSEATLRCAVDRGDVRVAVEDRGKGMDADALTRAAEPGHLGLFAVRERMEAMGGRLEIESAPGRGTTVTVVLPQVSIEQDSVER